MNNVLIVNGHPNPTSFSAALSNAYLRGASSVTSAIQLSLRDLDFDPILHKGYEEPQPLEPDLKRAADAILQAQHVAFFFPCWWNGPPALVKGFIERVFLPGFAFRYEPGHGLPRKLLTGRSGRLVSSMDSPRLWHRFINRNALETSFGRSTLKFVGFHPVKTTMLYGVGKLGAKEREDELSRMESLGAKDAHPARKRSLLPAPAVRLAG